MAKNYHGEAAVVEFPLSNGCVFDEQKTIVTVKVIV